MIDDNAICPCGHPQLAHVGARSISFEEGDLFPFCASCGPVGDRPGYGCSRDYRTDVEKAKNKADTVAMISRMLSRETEPEMRVMIQKRLENELAR